jgi:Arc/MetJ family transcription regulator
MCDKIHTWRWPVATNLAIDDELIDEARRVGGHTTKKQAVTVALEEYVARRKQLAVLELFGTIDFDKSSLPAVGGSIVPETCAVP